MQNPFEQLASDLKEIKNLVRLLYDNQPLNKTLPALPEEKSHYITRKQLSQEFHISYPTIRNREIDGTIVGYRIGRRVLFIRAEVELALKGGEL